jgi:hypothetical protein
MTGTLTKTLKLLVRVDLPQGRFLARPAFISLLREEQVKRHDLASDGRGRQRRIAGHAQDDQVIDTYKLRRKLAEPSRCPGCGAVFREGRWQWEREGLPGLAHEELCTACQRVNDNYPAGILTIKGPVVVSNKAELLALARRNEQAEKAEHCQNRIMAIEEPAEDELTIKTTDIHLPRRIGKAIDRAFHGDLQIHYDEGNYFVRVEWRRDH